MPSNPFSIMAALTASLIAAGFSAGIARAQDCLHWGDLDKKLYSRKSQAYSTTSMTSSLDYS